MADEKDEAFYAYFMEVINSASKLYLEGVPFTELILNKKLWNFQQEDGVGACYQLSAFGMFMLKDNPTAKICRGEYSGKEFKNIRHSWVEFQVPGDGIYVIDFAWMHPGFCNINDYHNHIHDGGGTLITSWICSSERFWSYKKSSEIYKKVKDPNGFVELKDLLCFGDPDLGYDFIPLA
ncbi:hypothetical protein IKG28_00450 [Candidatus Saccharibacteria bacterium]|nr:hypothetical protein [Candidatus Saccharibacteria bacterium]